MITEDVKALVCYRREQAEQALRDAKVLLDTGSLNASVNRSYYAMFYAVLALLCVREIGTSRHSGAIAMFDREFVHMGIFDKHFSQWLHEAFDLRQRADYKEMTVISRKDAELALQNAEKFVAGVGTQIDALGTK